MTESAESVAAFMRRHSLVLATAESCTSGLIASQLADVPGAGHCLDRAFVTYTVAAKHELLHVNLTTIERYNLTSVEVAAEMAVGVLAQCHANVVISNTGVVDDTDGGIPAGTQCLCWAFRHPRGEPTLFTESVRFNGDRRTIREQCARYALSRLPEYFRHVQHQQQLAVAAAL